MKKIFLFLFLFLVLFLSFPKASSSQVWTAQVSPVTTDLNSASAPAFDVCWMCGPTGVVVRTTNGGVNWARVDAGLAGLDFYTLFALDANSCWVGSGNGTLRHTTNGGTNWTLVPLTPANPFIDCIYFFDVGSGWILGDPAGNVWSYYITTNAGVNWTRPPSAPPATGGEAGWNNGCESLAPNKIWWVTNVSKIWKGTFPNGPFTSSPTGVQPVALRFLDANTGLYCLQTGPLMRTTNGGVSWYSTAFTPAATPYVMGGRLSTAFLSTLTAQYTYMSTNAGAVWFLSPFPYVPYCVTFFSQNRGWAGTESGHIYRWDWPVGIEPISNYGPTEFILKQNYPNPFNASTKISFELPIAGYITLKVYDALGREVKTLINESKAAGKHEIYFDAGELYSGIYFYRMQSGDYGETKKMMLLK